MIIAAALSGCHEEPPPPTRSEERSTDADAMARYEGDPRPRDGPVFNVRQAKAPAPMPTGPLPEDASCVTAECHAQLALASRVHAPVGQGQCAACHQPDTGEHRYPMKRDGNATCTFCHAIADAEHMHPPVEQAGCTTCHDPHGGPGKFLLTHATVGQLCAQCHDQPLERFAHGPFAAGQCNLCHNPHGESNALLLRGGTGADHCLGCHTDLARRMADAPFTHSPLLHDDCSTCHEAHTSEHRRLLVKDTRDLCVECHQPVADQIATATVSHGAIGREGSCANCHAPHASGQSFLLRDRQDRICVECHDRPVEGHDGRTVPEIASELAHSDLHGPVRSAECNACHHTHGGDYPNLLSHSYPETFYASFDLSHYALCFECHNKQMVLKPETPNLTRFRDGQRNLHFVHVNREDKGRTCRTCHAVHGSEQPRHIAEGVPFEGSDWKMPIGYERIDDGGRCSPGCHEPMTYRRTARADAAAIRGEP